MKTLPPAERPLPGKAEILERILSDTAVPDSGRRQGWLVPVGAAAAVALVAGGLLVVATRHDASRPSPADATPAPVRPSTPSTPAVPKQRPAAEIDVNAGSLTAAQKTAAAQACMAPQEGPHRPTAITHGIKVRTWGSGPADDTIAYTSPNGLRYACVGTGSMMTTSIVGGDPGVAAEHKTTLPVTDATHPAAPAEGTGATWAFIDFDRLPDQLAREGWYGVDGRVASMRQRWIVRGKTGPWFVAKPVDGLVFLRSWDRSAALKLGEEVRVETQVVGHNGELLDAPAGMKGGRLTASPGTTRVDRGKVVRLAGATQGELEFLR